MISSQVLAPTILAESLCQGEENVPDKPITGHIQVFLLWEEQGQNDLLFSAYLLNRLRQGTQTCHERWESLFMCLPHLVS